MTTLQTDDLIGTIQELVENAKFALEAETAERFVDFERHVNEADAFVRELQQEMWSDQAKTTIKKLERNEPLADTDKELIHTFLICDAERYLKHENNYADWKHELTRLMDELTTLARVADRDKIGDIRGLLKDAVRLVPDIRNYLEERSRVEKCKNATDHLNEQSRKQLAHLLREQLSSAKR